MALTQIQSGMIADAAVTTAKIADANITTAKVADANITPAKLSQPLTQGTSQASTSGTSITFTGIPSWAKRVTVMLNGVSTTGTNNLWMRIGSGSLDTSGYVSSAAWAGVSGPANGATETLAFLLVFGVTAGSTFSGSVTLCSLGSNIWVNSGVIAFGSQAYVSMCGGTKTLSGSLDRLSILTASTDTFDAGSINILYE